MSMLNHVLQKFECLKRVETRSRRYVLKSLELGASMTASDDASKFGFGSSLGSRMDIPKRVIDRVTSNILCCFPSAVLYCCPQVPSIYAAAS